MVTVTRGRSCFAWGTTIVALLLKISVQSRNTQLRHHKLEAVLPSLDDRLGRLHNVDASLGVVVPEGILRASQQRQLSLGPLLDALEGDGHGNVGVVGGVVTGALPDEGVLLRLSGDEEDGVELAGYGKNLDDGVGGVKLEKSQYEANLTWERGCSTYLPDVPVGGLGRELRVGGMLQTRPR